MKLLLGYNNIDSLVHRLDPRVKLCWLLGNMVLIIFRQDIGAMIVSLTLILAATALAQISLKVFLPLVKMLAVIGIQFIILQGFFRPQGQVLFQLAGFDFYLGGLLVGVKSLLLLLILALVFLQFLMWTSAEDLTLLLVKLRLPPKYAVLVGLALHFLPVIERDLRTIYESQQARGLELTTIRQKVKGLLPIMLPLILRALKRAQEVALSMELKGYNRYPGRTFMKEISFSKVDYLAMVIILVYLSGMAAAVWTG